MAITREITLNEQTIVVRELTVAEIRDWLKAVETDQSAPDIVDSLLIEGVDLRDLVRMSSLTTADMLALSPSQLRNVFDACKELNADFFGLRARLETLGRAALSMNSSAGSVE